MHTLAIGDIGVVDGMMHIGDEAMFEQFLDQARERGVTDVTAISAAPAETASRYGVRSVPRLGFSGDRRAMLARADSLLSDDLAPHDPARQTLHAVARADRVVVTGAGNLASNWPMHIFERWTLARLAERHDIPFIVSGQTLGPALTGADAALLRELLQCAALVGVRESASLAVAHRLGVDAIQTVDDASFLALDRLAAPIVPTPYCLVSLSTHVGDTGRGEFQRSVAGLLDEVASLTGLHIVFFAHFGPLDGDPQRGDVVMHEQVRTLMNTASTSVPTGDSAGAAWLARRADLVVSSRYHPAVFAVAAGVPTVGIAVDDYTTVKLTGALGNFGQHAVVTPSTLSGAAREPWEHRAEIVDRTRENSAARLATSADWWDRVVGTR